MDFFTRQEQARKKTKLLVFYFILALGGIIFSIYAVALGLSPYFDFVLPPDALAQDAGLDLWRPEMLGVIAAGVSLVVGMGSSWKSLQLSGGGSVVAQDLGGRPVPPQPTDPDERKLRNVVEEMALASGTPVPEIYLLEHEGNINAFAAGKTPSDSAIGVTRGCIRLLSRDELQGVIAHEFSHILNGDMRLNTRLIGLLHGILLITLIGRLIARSTMSSSGSSRESGRGSGGGPIMIFGLALLIIGYIGVFFGKLIKSAVSRQREFLADASAVQFTRLPDGIAGALKKIGGSLGSRLQTPNAEEASHLFFANGLTDAFTGLFSTHPPLDKRIRALQPDWDGSFTIIERKAPDPVSSAARPSPDFPGALPGGLGGLVLGGALASAGYSPAQMQAARQMLEQIPDSLKQELGDSSGASALIFALLLSSEATVRETQLAAVAEFSSALPDEVARLEAEVNAAPSRLALVDLALPALRALSPQQYNRFNQTLDALIEADARIELFEFTVKRMVQRHLGRHFGPSEVPALRYRSSAAVSRPITLLLSAFAHLGGGDVAEAYARGSAAVEGRVAGPLLPLDACGLDAIDDALNQLAGAVPMVKKNCLFACARVITADREVSDPESELLRAVADTIDAPLPPNLDL